MHRQASPMMIPSPLQWMTTLAEPERGMHLPFARFAIEAVETRYSVAGPAGAGSGRVGEVLIAPSILKPR